EPTDTPEPTNTPEPTATPAPAYEPVFETASCQFPEPDGYEVSCGYLIVPEDRVQTETDDNVQLHVAIFASTSDSPAADPVVYLEGGPGGNPLEALQFTFEDNYAPLLADRDVIIFDQRGTGFSEPVLDCQEVIDAGLEVIDQILPEEEELEMQFNAFSACRDRLVAEGANLAAYNSTANAADVNDLRIALGYEEWNIYGISYGTKLAMTTMRDFPEGIRSVVLDSAYPLPVGLSSDFLENVDRSFDTFFAGCAADEACNSAYPNLETTFFDTIAALDSDPVTIPVTNFLTSSKYDAAIDGSVLLGTLFQTLYSAEIIPILPRMITETAAGNYQLLGLLVSNSLTNSSFISQGMYTSVQCHEEIPFESEEEIQAAIDLFPELDGMIGDADTDFELCDLWQSGSADAIENTAVSSTIPTLVMAGEYDPITPPAWGEVAAATLSNSYFFEYPGVGHGASISGDCPQGMMLAFLNDPTMAPTDACIAEMGAPEFELPSDNAAADNLVPFTTDINGTIIEGIRPEEWEEQFAGVYLRGANGLDQTTLLQQAAPGVPPDLFVGVLADQLGLDGELEETGTVVDVNGRSWTSHAGVLQGLPVDIALTETDGITFVVLLITNPEDRDGLFETVFLPALDAITLAE
ncbi:MAG: alpha/beta hydrolase, partial [Chloroflexi bacterium]|nr:alpha/beta hydrolase [Chloroflexota bacterium]